MLVPVPLCNFGILAVVQTHQNIKLIIEIIEDNDPRSALTNIQHFFLSACISVHQLPQQIAELTGGLDWLFSQRFHRFLQIDRYFTLSYSTNTFSWCDTVGRSKSMSTRIRSRGLLDGLYPGVHRQWVLSKQNGLQQPACSIQPILHEVPEDRPVSEYPALGTVAGTDSG